MDLVSIASKFDNMLILSECELDITVASELTSELLDKSMIL